MFAREHKPASMGKNGESMARLGAVRRKMGSPWALLGIHHEKVTFLFEGRNQRLTDVGGDNGFAERLLA